MIRACQALMVATLVIGHSGVAYADGKIPEVTEETFNAALTECNEHPAEAVHEIVSILGNLPSGNATTNQVTVQTGLSTVQVKVSVESSVATLAMWNLDRIGTGTVDNGEINISWRPRTGDRQSADFSFRGASIVVDRYYQFFSEPGERVLVRGNGIEQSFSTTWSKTSLREMHREGAKGDLLDFARERSGAFNESARLTILKFVLVSNLAERTRAILLVYARALRDAGIGGTDLTLVEPGAK